MGHEPSILYRISLTSSTVGEPWLADKWRKLIGLILSRSWLVDILYRCGWSNFKTCLKRVQTTYLPALADSFQPGPHSYSPITIWLWLSGIHSYSLRFVYLVVSLIFLLGPSSPRFGSDLSKVWAQTRGREWKVSHCFGSLPWLHHSRSDRSRSIRTKTANLSII